MQAAGMSRRQFGLTAGGAVVAARLFSAGPSAPWNGPAVVRKVYLAKLVPSWPRPDLDVEQEKAALEAVLQEVEQKHRNAVKFTGGDLVRTAEQAQAFARSVGDEDGLLIVDLTSGTGPLLAPLKAIDKPALLYARPYSGWSYVDVARWSQEGKRCDLIVTSEPGDLDPYMRVFQTIHHLRTSKVLVFSQGSRNAAADGFRKQFGTEFSFPGYEVLKEIYSSMGEEKARKDAGDFVRGALKVIEPKPQEIVDSMRLYHAVMKLLEREKANAIAIDCLGGFARGDLPAYPCLAWTKLNDAGMYGVCEADVPSTMTQLLLTSFSGKPGFVSDPVFDTSRNEILHAHCVSATTLLGLGGPASPYIIRSHMEDSKGVSLQVLVPIQETITCAKFLTPDSFAISTGTVIGNVENARGCRTKFRTRVDGDARKMLERYSGGLHRVIFYGDYLEPAERMARMMGFKILREA